MTAMNTIRAIETLTRTGFSEEQARAVVGVVSDVVEDGTVTKLDFVELKAELRNDFAELKAELRNDFAGQKAELRSSIVELGRELSRQIATVDAKVDTRVAALETGIANAKVQMVLYTGGIVAAAAAVTRLFN
ncbi:MAG TPA: hypothetical protein VIR38_05945 [Thalassobaculum sp.]